MNIRWKYNNPDGTPIKDVTGPVIAYAIGPDGKFRMLVQTATGFETVEAVDVVACDPPGLNQAHDNPAITEAVRRAHEERMEPEKHEGPTFLERHAEKAPPAEIPVAPPGETAKPRRRSLLTKDKP